MYYSGIKEFDISNGPGIRTSLYVSGCTHHCPGCFNESTWDFNSGKEFTDEDILRITDLLEDRDGLSLLGGDPLDNVCESLCKLCRNTKLWYPKKTIWLWTGYTWEQILKDEVKFNFVKKYIDVVVDGRFVESKKDIKLKFKGSTNQCVIDVKESIKHNKKVILEKYNN